MGDFKKSNACFDLLMRALNKFRRAAKAAGSPVKSFSFIDLGNGNTRAHVCYEKPKANAL